MTTIASQISSLAVLFTQPFIETQIKENIKAPRHWPLWGTGEFPAQRASYAENVSIWWRHHVNHDRYLESQTDFDHCRTCARGNALCERWTVIHDRRTLPGVPNKNCPQNHGPRQCSQYGLDTGWCTSEASWRQRVHRHVNDGTYIDLQWDKRK